MSRERREKRTQADKRYKILSAIAKIEGRQFNSEAQWKSYFDELLTRRVLLTWPAPETGRRDSLQIIAQNIDCTINITEAQHILEGALS